MGVEVAAQRILHLEAQRKMAVDTHDYGRAGVLQSQIAAARQGGDSQGKVVPAARREDFSASGRGHAVRGAVEADLVAEKAAAQQHVLALESRLEVAVQARDYGLAGDLQSQIAVARQAGASQGKMKAAAGHEQISSTCPGRAAEGSRDSVGDEVAAQRILHLEAQRKMVVDTHDYGRAGVLQS